MESVMGIDERNAKTRHTRGDLEGSANVLFDYNTQIHYFKRFNLSRRE